LQQISGLNNEAGAPVLDSLVFKPVSYALILLLVLTGLILAVVSLKKELISDSPLNGLFFLVLIIAGFCVLIALATAYVQFQWPASILLRWERAALNSEK
jgi:hypothetical protein